MPRPAMPVQPRSTCRHPDDGCLDAHTSSLTTGAGTSMKNLFLGLLLLLVVLQLTLWLGDGGLLDLWDQYQNVEVQREENERLQERNAALNAEVLDLKQGLDAVEEHAREDLGMVKEGEVFYQVVE